MVSSMDNLSKAIGDGVQTFRIRNFDQHFSIVEDFGPDYADYLESGKIVKLIDEDILYALVRVPYKDMEELMIRITTDINSINWREIADKTEYCRWRGPELDQRYIN
jgi:hypothetical protein